MERRHWVPNVKAIADQLIADYRESTWTLEGLGPEGSVSEGDSDALATMASWIATAHEQGEEFTEDDWIALVQELARRAAGNENDAFLGGRS
ncbi:hypothetical protein A5675_15325 [Mycobacterium malmoense]|uniref:hypothetical protein n=1 Tax=Mycobacterium malmoense TaxID=1780 RepID=UPI00081EF73D|nr:hypothetical protein [Mycobacterium malmoense]OCB38759.1 hypothetical protein A5675_15325 [Mycobacterium malmoense]